MENLLARQCASIQLNLTGMCLFHFCLPKAATELFFGLNYPDYPFFLTFETEKGGTGAGRFQNPFLGHGKYLHMNTGVPSCVSAYELLGFASLMMEN